jgi:ankyrin repeat protein
VASLLKAGAEVDKAEELNGWSPLHCVAHEGHYTVVAVLLKAGATIEKESDNGLTPLIMAAVQGHELVLSELLKAGAIDGRPYL